MPAPDPQHSARAEIDLGALARNLAALRVRAAGRRVIGVVKADAYGHGAVCVSRALAQLGCEALAVATVHEGLELRCAGLELPILLLQGPHVPEHADAALRAGLAAALISPEAIPLLEAAARRAARPFSLHMKVDTGMGRLGVLPEELDAVLDRLAAAPQLELQGVMTHLAESDDPAAPATERQRQRFADVLVRLRQRGLAPPWVHVDQSAGLIHGPTAGTNAVRPGLALYGADPTLEGGHGLEPVMTLCARVLATKRVPAGARVGYGGSYVTARPTRLAVIPLGYADGLPRAASGRFAVGLLGQRVPLAGRISMDLCVADVGELPVEAGAEALIFGRAGGLEIRVEELAAAAGMIPYEVLVGIGNRVPRVASESSAPRTRAADALPDAAPAGRRRSS